MVEAIVGLPALLGIYHSASSVRSGNHFFRDILSSMNIQLNVQSSDVERIPITGAAIVVANHPFGGIEGIALGALIHSIRPDMKIMANPMNAPTAMGTIASLFTLGLTR